MPGSITANIVTGRIRGVPKKIEIFSDSAKRLAPLACHWHHADQVKRPE